MSSYKQHFLNNGFGIFHVVKRIIFSSFFIGVQFSKRVQTSSAATTVIIVVAVLVSITLLLILLVFYYRRKYMKERDPDVPTITYVYITIFQCDFLTLPQKSHSELLNRVVVPVD